jgi:hypothetical protein
MTAAAITPSDARLDIGWVIGATWRVLRTRAVDLILVALPFLWLPSLISGLAPDNRPVQLLMNLPGLVFTGAGSLITYQTLTAGLPVTASDATRAAAGRFGTLWLVALASGLLLIIGLVLLIVPGVIAGVGFCTASAAVMAENKNTTPAMERAWDLSRGQRWRLVGLAGLLLLASLGVLMIIVIGSAILGIAGLQDAIDPAVNLGFGPVVETAIAMITTVGIAAAYVGLRKAKEGPAEDIARTFE